jgi:hypothetical protein
VNLSSVSGQAVNWQIDVFLDGAHVNILDPNTGQVSSTLKGQISPGEAMGGLTAIGTLLPGQPPGPTGFTAVPTAQRSLAKAQTRSPNKTTNLPQTLQQRMRKPR